MRYIFYFWFLPMAFFWGWFALSYNDWSMGTLFFSRQMHDMVFGIYASVLKIEPSTVVWLLAKACVLDTFIIFGIYGFRKRKQIKNWWQMRRAGGQVALPHDPAE